MGGRGEMTKAPISLQDLRRRIYAKAKAEASWRFWGLFVHVCKMETLREAYGMAKANNGAPGLDGVTFEAIESAGVEAFLEQIRDELVTGTYQPTGYWRQAIPKDGGHGERVLSIAAIRDRVVQELLSSSWSRSSRPTSKTGRMATAQGALLMRRSSAWPTRS
jgi:RNA-directed DNA polymerase